jgi:aminoglycoside 3-N-acetyltransferase
MADISRKSIVQDFYNLGVVKGDIIFITSDLYSVGLYYKNKKETLKEWIEILLEVVGEKGCIIMASYTDTFFRFQKDKNIIFNRYSKTNVGPLSNFLIDDPRSVRSKHPTNSCIGIGYEVEKILDDHDENSLSYSVLGKIIEQNGKFLLIGTLDKKNAPQTMHYAQEVLGYTLQTPYKGLFQTYYEDDKKSLKIFTRKDYGGCSRGAYALYGTLIVNNAIFFGFIGNAYSAIMDGKKSFEVILEVLKKNRKLIRCEDKNCTDCYGNIHTNGFKVIPHYLRKILRIIKSGQIIKKGN